VAFYFLSRITGVLLISQFWTLANDVYDARQAKRLFGFVGGGASLGGAVGAGLTALLVEEIGSNSLVLVSAVVLAACALIVMVIVRRTNVSGGVEVAPRTRCWGPRSHSHAVRLAPVADPGDRGGLRRGRRHPDRPAAQHGR
jgi:MFS family permease